MSVCQCQRVSVSVSRLHCLLSIVNNSIVNQPINQALNILGLLTDAQVKERWDQPLTSRVLGGMEPNLILFYDFDSPASVNIPNLGSAGSDYDLVSKATRTCRSFRLPQVCAAADTVLYQWH